MKLQSKPNQNSWIENYNFRKNGHEITDELVGKAVRLHYKSGHILEQHWQTTDRVLWKGIAGGLDGHNQLESYKMLKISDNIYFITWVEEFTTTGSDQPQSKGPWLTDVVLDLNKMIATASWMGPTNVGKVEHVLDQALITYIESDISTSLN